MIKDLLIFNIFFYLLLAFVWQILFEYKILIKCCYKVNGKEELKQLSGIKLTLICLFWIVLLPIIIKKANVKEEE